jgi:hypothetical protein
MLVRPSSGDDGVMNTWVTNKFQAGIFQMVLYQSWINNPLKWENKCGQRRAI